MYSFINFSPFWNLFIVLVFLSAGVFAQGTKTITGTVTDLLGQPLPGATVVEQGTTNGTVTNSNGVYTINVKKDATLAFSFVGMKPQIVKVTNQNQINIQLEEDAIGLEEVVAIGYGTQTKKDITGAVTSVKVEEMMKQSGQNFQSLMQGRVAGLQITPTSGAPGATVNVNIRGSSSLNAGTSPLYVIDGIQISGDTRDAGGYSSYTPRVNPMSLLNPNDIESVNILKDASATAIYGARGANGVIIITTKRAKSGQNTIVNIDSYAGVQNLHNTLDLMNGAEHAAFLNEFQESIGANAPFSAQDITQIGEGTNWQDEVFRTAVIQSHQVSVTGSSDATSFYLSGSYFDQEGIALNTGLVRSTLRSNIDHKFNEKFKLKTALTISRTINDAGRDANLSSNFRTPIQKAYATSPTINVFDENGEYIRNWVGSNKPENPVESLKTLESKVTNDNFLSNIAIDYNIIPGLIFQTSLGIDANNSSGEVFFPSPGTYLGSLRNGWGFVYNRKITTVMNENTLTFKRVIGEHNINAVGGVSIQQTNDFSSYIEAFNFPSSELGINNLGGTADVPEVNSSSSKRSLVGFLGRVNYQHKNKYLATASIRRDGSSVFAENKKWGTFPSFSLGWRLSEEGFLSGVEAINELKLRAGYGVTGNQNISPYQSLAAVSVGAPYIIGGSVLSGSTITRLANSELGWEETNMTNVGFDLNILNNSVFFTFDYFDKTTSDMLFDVILPANSGYSSGLFNTGSVTNNGIELSLGANLFREHSLKWNVEMNFTKINNTVKDLGSSSETIFQGYSGEFSGTGVRILREDEPFGSFYGWKYEGVWHNQQELDEAAAQGFNTTGLSPGDARYLDYDGDKAITSADRIIIGNPHPDFSFGINNNFVYKDFSLNIFITGVMGQDIINGASAEIMNPSTIWSNKHKDLLDRWTPTNTSSDIPRANFSNWTPPSSYLIEDGSYIKLQNVQIAYAFSKLPGWLKNAKIYVSGQNLYTFTEYKGIDPSTVGSNGIDQGAYPTSTTWTFGVNLDF